jgi:ketosteroid isomerase-like protein
VPTTQETAAAFYSHIENKDFAAVRSLLHDDLDFQGPMASFDSADALVAMLQGLSEVTASFRRKHLFVDGEKACFVYDLITHTPIGPSPVAEYLVVRDGRIASIRAHFDAAPWAALSTSE